MVVGAKVRPMRWERRGRRVAKRVGDDVESRERRELKK